MLVAVLNTCTKEELEEVDHDLAVMSPTTAAAETAERRKVIKNKIMAVGRMARVFALLRYCSVSSSWVCWYLMLTTAKSLRKYPNSKVFPVHPNFHMGLSHLEPKELRKLSVALTMRAYLRSR